MNLRCNVCSIEIDEKKVDFHIGTSQHLENKEKIVTNGRGIDKSVVNMWHKSLN